MPENVHSDRNLVRRGDCTPANTRGFGAALQRGIPAAGARSALTSQLAWPLLWSAAMRRNIERLWDKLIVRLPTFGLPLKARPGAYL